jgi:TRAP-type transport system periplasmic protein
MEQHPHLQGIIQGINNEWIVKHGEAWDSSDAIGLDYVKSLGHEIIDLLPAEAARWQKAIGPVMDSYIKKMDDKGFPEKKIVDFVKTSLPKN